MSLEMREADDLFAGLDDNPAREEPAPAGGEPHERAIAAIERILREFWSVAIAWSSGKDSSAAANLVFNAALNVIAAGHACPPIAVIHVDTGIESPVVRAIADGEIEKMRSFAAKHGIPLDVQIGRPTLNASFAVRVIGGRSLPTFPWSASADCSISWKRDSAQRVKRELLDRLPATCPGLLTVIGTRSDESAARRTNTAARGETDTEIWYSVTGEAMLSPILRWSTDDVWTWLAESAQGLHPSYSDFREIFEFYSDAGGSSCVIVADMKSAANAKACGARAGCYLCTRASADHSVEAMIEAAPEKYPYLVPLLALRDFIANTATDWNRRNYICRTIDADGMVRCMADQYSPQMCEDLLRYALAAQDRANELGAPSRVEIVGLRELVAIDAYWSMRAWHKPFHALKIWLEHEAGVRQYAPRVQPSPMTPVPEIGKVFVGSDWDDDASPLFRPGLRYPLWEMHSDSCGPSLRSNAAGKVFLQLEESPQFDVDEEGAADFITFEAERMIDLHHTDECLDWTIGFMIYAQYGVLTPAVGQSSQIDAAIRRAQWLQRHGLHGHQTAEMLRPRCVERVAGQSELFA